MEYICLSISYGMSAEILIIKFSMIKWIQFTNTNKSKIIISLALITLIYYYIINTYPIILFPTTILHSKSDKLPKTSILELKSLL